MDAFSGSGTTLAVSSELKRRWIGIDRSPEALKTTLKRFERGLEPMGDFVELRQASHTAELFPDLSGRATSTRLQQHRITDFDVYVERGRESEFNSLVKADVEPPLSQAA